MGVVGCVEFAGVEGGGKGSCATREGRERLFERFSKLVLLFFFVIYRSEA